MFDFVYATCQPASQKWLKEEVRQRRPDLRFAFSRPGLLTFKATAPLGVEQAPSFALARASGFSLGRASTADELAARLVDVPAPRVVQAFFAPGAEGDAAPAADELARVEGALSERFGLSRGRPDVGDWVLDVIVPREISPRDGASPEPVEPWLVGLHRHDASRSSQAGGPVPVVVPEASPSRAYAKIAEAIAGFELPFAAGQRALELGAAPGGAVLALLERGLDVLALDPAELDSALPERARELGRQLVHLHMPAMALTRDRLGGPVHWLLSDMNLAPQVAVHVVERTVALVRRELLGAVITLKMNDGRAVASIPALLDRLGALGLGAPRACQLPSHRSECVVVLAGAR